MTKLITYESRLNKSPEYGKRLAHLLRAAATVIAEEGYEKASIRKVSAEAQLGLSGIYYYVSCKEELLYLIQFHTFTSILQRLKQLLQQVEAPKEQLMIVIKNHLAHFLSNIAELKVCARELDSLTGDYYHKVLAVRREYFTVTLHIVKRLTDSELDPYICTTSLFGMLNWIYQWFDQSKRISLDKLAEQLYRLFLNGVCQRVIV